MSFFDDHEDEIIYGWCRNGEEPEPFARKAPQCNRCGAKDVRWRQQSGRWVLFSLQPGVVHRCPVSPDEFPEV